MQTEPILGIIELGNLKIKCIIFKIVNNEITVLSTSIIESKGIHNDTIINLTKASEAIRSCVSKAESIAKISLKKINIVFEQPDFLCTKFSKNKKIDGSKIYKDDIEFLLKEAKKQLLLNDEKQSIIHIFNHNYIVDDKKFVEEPIGVYADSLTHEITFVTAPKNNIKNIKQVFINCDLEVERLISRIFALGAKLLNKNELEFGSAIIDLGFEKISFGFFKNFALVHSTTYSIGVNHIIKDISKVCSLDINEARLIFENIDFSFQENNKIFDENDFLRKNFFINSSFRKISKSLIIDIIKARLDEILNKFKNQLIVPDLNLKSGMNILITGGGSNIVNLKKYIVSCFGINIKTLEQNYSEDKKNWEIVFSSCLGAAKIIKDGWETEAIPKITNKHEEKMGFFGKLFKIN